MRGCFFLECPSRGFSPARAPRSTSTTLLSRTAGPRGRGRTGGHVSRASVKAWGAAALRRHRRPARPCLPAPTVAAVRMSSGDSRTCKKHCALFRVQAEPRYFSVLLGPHNPVCAQETVTLNSRRGGPAVKILSRGPRVPSAPHPILSPAPPDPASHPNPGRTASAFPYHSENRRQLQNGAEKGYFYSTPKTSLHGTRCFKNQHPKRHEMVFLCVLSFLVWQIEVLRNDRLFMFTSP